MATKLHKGRIGAARRTNLPDKNVHALIIDRTP